MTETVIKIQNLGKRYRYGGVAPLSDSLRTDLTDWAKGLLRLQKEKRLPGTHHASFRQVQAHRLDVDPNYFWALRDVNLEIKKGEVVGVIGRNGSGKSTMLKILSRITPPTSGTITYHGRVASLLEVGTGFHRELTGRENVFLNGSILGMKRAEIARKFDEIVAFAEVDKFIDTPVKFYSSGMYVRLAFAVAAHLQPEILIVDEVLAVGDAAFQNKCLGKMDEVARQGRTVLFVSHNMAAIENLCTRCICVHDGRICADAETEEAVQKYMQLVQSTAPSNDLASLPRDPGLSPVIRKIEFENEHGDLVDVVPTGSPLTVLIHYANPSPIADPYFGLAFETNLGTRVFWVQTRLQMKHFPDLPAAGIVKCHIPRFPLLPGSYLISSGCGSRNQQLDLLHQACRLNVVEADAFGTGRLPHSSQGLVIVDSTWEAVPERALKS